MWARGYEYLESALKTATPKIIIDEDINILHYQELNVIVKQYYCGDGQIFTNGNFMLDSRLTNFIVHIWSKRWDIT